MKTVFLICYFFGNMAYMLFCGFAFLRREGVGAVPSHLQTSHAQQNKRSEVRLITWEVLKSDI
jgi:hypothetical protein